MELNISNATRAEIFTTLFQHMKLFTENMNIHFNEDNIFIQGMDSSHVSIFEINLPKEWFDVYNIDGNIIIGVNTNILFKVLNTREKTHNICLKLEETDSDKLQISLLSESKDTFDRHYEIPLVDLDEELMVVPEIEYQVDISLLSTTFSTLIDQMKIFGDTFNIVCNENKVEMSSESQDCGKMFVNVSIDDLSSYAIEEKGNLDMSFSLTYLKNICLFNKISKEIEICISKDYPIKLTYTLDHDSAKATFYLAPKIDD